MSVTGKTSTLVRWRPSQALNRHMLSWSTQRRPLNGATYLWNRVPGSLLTIAHLQFEWPEDVVLNHHASEKDHHQSSKVKSDNKNGDTHLTLWAWTNEDYCSQLIPTGLHCLIVPMEWLKLKLKLLTSQRQTHLCVGIQNDRSAPRSTRRRKLVYYNHHCTLAHCDSWQEKCINKSAWLSNKSFWLQNLDGLWD